MTVATTSAVTQEARRPCSGAVESLSFTAGGLHRAAMGYRVRGARTCDSLTSRYSVCPILLRRSEHVLTCVNAKAVCAPGAAHTASTRTGAGRDLVISAHSTIERRRRPSSRVA